MTERAPPPRPLTPRRGLFVALLIAWAAWIGFVLALNFLT